MFHFQIKDTTCWWIERPLKYIVRLITSCFILRNVPIKHIIGWVREIHHVYNCHNSITLIDATCQNTSLLHYHKYVQQAQTYVSVINTNMLMYVF